MEDKFQIIGKRWFDKKNGNTYHSVEVFKNNKLIASKPFEYGYDDHYKTTAIKLMIDKGIFPKTGERLSSGMMADEYNAMQKMRDNRDDYLFSVSDVNTKKELKVPEMEEETNKSELASEENPDENKDKPNLAIWNQKASEMSTGKKPISVIKHKRSTLKNKLFVRHHMRAKSRFKGFSKR